MWAVGFPGLLAPRFSAVLRAVWLGLIAVAAMSLLVPGVARADTTTTINFEAPAIAGTTSPAFGPALSNQYESQGVKFIDPSTSPVASPVGFAGPFSPPYLYRDTANAHSGTQVLYAHLSYSEGESASANFFAQLSTETTSVSLYVGAQGGYPGGETVDLTGYDPQGNVVLSDSSTAGAKDDTLLQVSSSTANIAYFSVAVPDGGSPQTPTLEVDDLSFVVPAAPPPPDIVLPPSALYGPVGSQGESTSLAFTIGRLNGANDPVDLAVSGLPSGVSVTGGTTIAANSDTTTLEFSVAPSAPLVSDAPFTITATSSDVSGSRGPVNEKFTVAAALSLQLKGPTGNVSGLTVPMGPCSNTIVPVVVTTGSGVSTPTSLTLTARGDATGLSDSLASSSVPPAGGDGAVVNLSLARTSAAGSGDLDITITATNGNAPPVSVSVIVHRTGLVAQGLYVTQGIQPDTGFLTPSGTGQSGGSYQGVALVAGKVTVVRLYADAPANPEGVAGTSALLYGYSQNGSPLPGSPLEPDYGPTALPDTNPFASSNYSDVVLDSELESDANAYTFTLPYGWVGGSLYLNQGKYPASPGPIRLSGKILPPYASSGPGSASCVASNTFTLTNVTFNEVGHNYGAEIVPVAMTVNGAQPPPPAQVFADAGAATPLPDGSVGGVVPYYATGDITDIANSSQSASQKNAAVLGRLESYDLGACCEVVGVTLGTAYGDTNTTPTNGKRPGGMFSSGTATYSVVNGSPAGTPGARPLTSVTHELFHQFGLVHASNECGGGQDGDGDDIGQTGESWQPLAPAPGEPTENPPNDGIGQLDGIGLNPTTYPYQFIATGSPSFPGNPQAYDVMSYCANVGGGDPNDWVSPRNWRQLISNFGTGAAADVATAASAARGAAAEKGRSRRLHGSMRRG